MSVKKPILVLDVECTGLSWRRDRLHGVGVRWLDGARYETNFKDSDLIAILEDAGIDKLGHNITFDVKFLRAAGLQIGRAHV